MYDIPQVPNEKPAVSSLVPEIESKEVVSSNIQHVTNSVGNYTIQKERVKWSILLILLIALSVLNLIILITLFTTQVTCPQVTCPQVTNTTEMVQSIVQEVLSLRSQEMQERPSNVNEEILFQLINMSYDNIDLLKTHIELTQSINNIVKVDDVLETLNSSLVSSCQDIKDKQPNSPSGNYHTNRELVYCEMGELCSTEGGWTRIAYLNMTDPTVDCPTGFKLHESGDVRACGRSSDNAPGCQSIKFPSNGISYSEVCGRVVGYQFGSPDALRNEANNIDSHYVDGVSITQGYPRKHVWTLIKLMDFTKIICILVTTVLVTHHLVINPRHLLVMIISVSLVILIVTGHLFYFILMILSGMVKGVVLKRETVVQLLVSHGFIRHLALLLNILR